MAAASPANKMQSWIVLGLLGIGTVVAGLLAPQVLPASSTPEPAPAARRTALEYQPPAWPEAPDYQSLFTRLIIGTVLVLALCVGCLWFFRHRLRGIAATADPSAQLRLAESLSLGNRCQLHLVQVAEQPVLIGMDGGGVKSIVPLPESFAEALRRFHETREQAATNSDAEPAAAAAVASISQPS